MQAQHFVPASRLGRHTYHFVHSLFYVTASLRIGGEPVTYGDHVLVVGDAAGKEPIFK